MEIQSISPYSDSLVDACIWGLDELKYARAAIRILLGRLNRSLSTMTKGTEDNYKNELRGPDGKWIPTKYVDVFSSQDIDTKELDTILLSNTTSEEQNSLNLWT